MQHGENNREGKGKDTDITTEKGERKLKGKGKEREEESKEKVSRWDKERRRRVDGIRRGEGKRKRNMYW